MSEISASAAQQVAAQLLERSSLTRVGESYQLPDGTPLLYDGRIGFLTLGQAGDAAATIVGFNVMEEGTPDRWHPTVRPDYDAGEEIDTADLWDMVNKGGLPGERIYNSPAAVAGRREQVAYDGTLAILGVRIELNPVELADSRRRSGLHEPDERERRWVKFGLMEDIGRQALSRARTTRESGDQIINRANTRYAEGTRVALLPQTYSGRWHQIARRTRNPIPPAFAVLLDSNLTVQRLGTVPAYGSLRQSKRWERRQNPHL